jgi:hypothetical protein
MERGSTTVKAGREKGRLLRRIREAVPPTRIELVHAV